MTETQTVDLAAWLTRIWDEEEQAMQRVGKRVWFVCDDGHFEEPVVDDDPWEGTGEYERWDTGEYRLPNHHNTWLEAFNPAQVLARIAADRKILELHTAAHECPELRTGTYPADWPESASWGQPGGTWKHTAVERYEDGEYCPTLRLLASPYKGREGWQEAWE